MSHPRHRNPPVDEYGGEPFDALTARGEAAIEAQEQFESDCREADADARWARSVDYC